MFEAYSQSKGQIVNVKDQFNLNEVFSCPNPQCSAKFTLRSVNGKKAKYFGRLKSTPHCKGCPYDKSSNCYLDSDHIVKYPLEVIFNGASSRTALGSSLQREKHDKSSLSDTTRNFIRTPKQLYYFCISNSLDTPYTDTLTVGDIVLDNRNLQHNANFRGISGLRLVIAETIKFDLPQKCIILRLYQRTSHNKFINLTITVYLEIEFLNTVIDYIIKTHGRFLGYHVAILGNWSIDEKYKISYTLQNHSHFLFKV